MEAEWQLKREDRPVVYVVQDTGKNMTSALEYGTCETLLGLREEATMLNVPSIVEKIRYGLRYFRKQDYILLAGNPVSIAVAAALASEMTGGQFNVLKWDGQEGRYWPAIVNIHQGE